MPAALPARAPGGKRNIRDGGMPGGEVAQGVSVV